MSLLYVYYDPLKYKTFSFALEIFYYTATVATSVSSEIFFFLLDHLELLKPVSHHHSNIQIQILNVKAM